MAYTCDLGGASPSPLLKGSPHSGQRPAERAALLLFHLLCCSISRPVRRLGPHSGQLLCCSNSERNGMKVTRRKARFYPLESSLPFRRAKKAILLEFAP